MGIERMGKSKGGYGGRIVNINSTAGIDVCTLYILFANHIQVIQNTVNRNLTDTISMTGCI